VDVVLGVSMAPKTVRMVLLEGESAGGVTVDEDNFNVAPESARGRHRGPGDRGHPRDSGKRG
jgi:hypothetical protein